MNQMFDTNHRPLPPGDPLHEVYRRGRAEWDERLGDAIAREHSWKMACLASLGVLALSVAGNVWQGAQSRTQVVHVLHDNTNDVIGITITPGVSGEPTQAMFAAALREWITNVRTVSMDVGTLKRNIISAYRLVNNISPAKTALDEFYTRVRDPFKFAQTSIVEVSQQVALPPPADFGTVGPRTWRIEWVEAIKDRTGLPLGMERWEANVTWNYVTPRTAAEAFDDPDGIHISAFSWSKR